MAKLKSLFGLFSAVGLLISIPYPAFGATLPPSAASGIAWLQSQLQTDGSLANENLSIATPLQAGSETATSLGLAGTIPSGILDAVIADTGTDTESLARHIVALGQRGQDPGSQIQLLLANQNQDGGFGSYPGYGSEPLDTAWALLALHAAGSNATAASSALLYLQNEQNTDGSYSLDDQEDLYTTSYVVMAQAGYASQYPISGAIQSAVTYIQSLRSTGALWNNSVFLTAIAYQAIHDFVPLAPTGTDVQGVLTGAQAADGSWGEDPYVTALAVGAIALTAQAQSNPALTSIQGTVVDGSTGLPLDGVSVTLSGAVSATATTVQGAFSFTNIPAGAYTLQFTLANYGTVTTQTTTNTGGTLSLGTVTLVQGANPTTGTVRGTITDAATGLPISGATVTAGTASTVTDASGDYEFDNVAPGNITLQASASGYTSFTGSAALVAGGIVVFSPALSAPSSTLPVGSYIEGTITNSAHTPLAGVTVTVSGAFSASAVTDSNGNYAISATVPGVVTLQASLTGYDTVTSAATVFASAGTSFSPVMYPTGTTPTGVNTSGISGTVVDSTTNAPLANVSVVVTSPNGGSQSAVTAADGSFTVTGLTQAQAGLTFSLSGYVTSQFSTALAPLANLALGQVRLRPAGVGQLLPDLVVNSVDGRSQVSTDPQTLVLSGTVQVVIGNRGTAQAPAGVQLLAFYDVNGNGTYDPGVDLVLGSIVTSAALDPQATQALAISVSGTVPFRDIPITVWVNSAQTVVESNAGNNYGNSTALIKLTALPTSITPSLKWTWTDPTYNNVLGPVIVGHLTDDNGDGKYDQNDIPTLVFGAGNTSDNGGSTILVAASGKDGHELWRRTDLNVTNRGSVAIADIDGDGKPEIIASNKDRTQLMALRNDGTTLWSVPSGPQYVYGSFEWVSDGITIADLNQDGQPEIIQGNHVYNNKGQLLWAGQGDTGGPNNTDGAGNWTGYAEVPIAADVDPDSPGMEVIAGRTLYGADGHIIWNRTDIPCDGYNGVGDFGYPKPPQIVLVSCGNIYLLDRNGNTIWKTAVAGGGHGGTPTIADFDGEGRPQIGVAGEFNYGVYGWDGSIRWTTPTHDITAVTGSSAFDFLDNGRVEVLYGDEGHFHIYDGATGATLWSTNNPSTTTIEYPVVADVDNDGHAEVIVASNYSPDFSSFPVSGVRVYGDATLGWAPTRDIWNEHAYHITNINDDGSVPRVEQNSWQASNTYRLNAFPNHSATAEPDISASYLRVQDFGGSQPSVLTVRIGNGGGVTVPSGVPVAFYNGDPKAGGILLGTTRTTQDLAQGVFQDVSITIHGSLAGISYLYAVADDDGTGHGVVQNDWDPANNVISMPLAALPGSFSITAATDQPTYGPDAPVALSAVVANGGSFAGQVQVRFIIETADGSAQVAAIPLPSPLTVAASSSGAVSGSWNTGLTLAGNYRLKAELLDGIGVPYAAAFAPFSISAGVNASSAEATLRTSTDRITYNTTDTVDIADLVASVTDNSLLSLVHLHVVVTDPSGNTVGAYDHDLGQLAPGALDNLPDVLALNHVVQGQYTVSGILTDSTGATLATGSATFTVAENLARTLIGQVSLQTPSVYEGNPEVCTNTAINNGTLALSNQPLQELLVNLASGTTLSTTPSAASLGPTQQQQMTQTIDTTPLPVGTYTCVLQAEEGGSWTTLGYASFQVTDPTAALTGTLTATPSQVPLTTVLTLTGSVTDGGSAAVPGVTATLSIQDPSGNTVFSSPTSLGTLNANQTSQLLADWTATGTVGAAYTAVLTATVGPKSKTLAQAPFTLLPPPIKLGLSDSAPAYNRVLVLLNCPEGDEHEDDHVQTHGRSTLSHDDGGDGHDHQSDCLASRSVTLNSLLTGLGVPYLLTTDVPDFMKALRSGRYNQYWVLGAIPEGDSNDQVSEELEEAVNRGDSLLTDGGLGGFENQELLQIAGAGFKGQLPEGYQGPAKLLAPVFTAASLPTATGDLDLVTTTGVAAANFTATVCDDDDDHDHVVKSTLPHDGGGHPSCKSETVPAVITQSYGQGHAAILGFDLLATLQQDPTSGWQAAVGQLLQTLLPAVPASLPPLGYLPVLTTVQNQGEATTLSVTDLLPSGAQYVDANPTPGSTDPVTWTAPLAVNQSLTFQVGITVPGTSGSYSLTSGVGTTDATGSLTPYGSVSFAFTVQDTSGLEQQLSTELAAIAPGCHDGDSKQRIQDAQHEYQDALTDAGNQDWDGAIGELLEASEDLEDLGTPATTARLDLDRLIQAFELQWYVSGASYYAHR